MKTMVAISPSSIADFVVALDSIQSPARGTALSCAGEQWLVHAVLSRSTVRFTPTLESPTVGPWGTMRSNCHRQLHLSLPAWTTRKPSASGQLAGRSRRDRG